MQRLSPTQPGLFGLAIRKTGRFLCLSARRPNPDHRFRLQMGGLGGAPILAKTRSGQTPILEPKRGVWPGGKMRCNVPLPSCEAVSLREPVLSRAACWSPQLHSPLL